MKKKGPYSTLKTLLKTLILMIIIACVAPFFLKGPDDSPLLEPKDLKIPDIKTPKVPDIGVPGLKKPNEPKKIYKWKDKNGVWHFSNKEKPETDAEVILVEPDRHPPPAAVPEPKGAQEKPSAPPRADDPSRITFPMTISPSEVKKLKEDAEKIKVELQKRYEEIGKQLGE